jgi:hypothetical protein
MTRAGAWDFECSVTAVLNKGVFGAQGVILHALVTRLSSSATRYPLIRMSEGR